MAITEVLGAAYPPFELLADLAPQSREQLLEWDDGDVESEAGDAVELGGEIDEPQPQMEAGVAQSRDDADEGPVDYPEDEPLELHGQASPDGEDTIDYGEDGDASGDVKMREASPVR